MLPKGTVAARVDGELRDLSFVPEADAGVEPVDRRSDDGLHVLRHSTAHVLAQAVCDSVPGRQVRDRPRDRRRLLLRLRPPRARSARPTSSKIDRRMRQIVKQNQPFIREEVSRAEASERAWPTSRTSSRSSRASRTRMTVEAERPGDTVSLYRNEEWTDLCMGPHVPHTGTLGAFKLTNVAGAYWRGDEANPQLTRIYGTAWATQDDLDAYLHRLEEAERRDHRKLGADLDLFSFPEEIGSGLAVFHPKGGLIRRLMEDYSRQRHEEGGYEFVNSPHITKADLFETSGHLDVVRRRHVPSDGARRGHRVLPEAHELPDAHPDLPEPDPELPGAAAAAVRVRHRVPLREVGRGPRPHPRARAHDGRRAHLRDQGADGRGAAIAARVRAGPAPRLRARRLLHGAVDDARGQGRGIGRGVGGGDRGARDRPPGPWTCRS